MAADVIDLDAGPDGPEPDTLSRLIRHLKRPIPLRYLITPEQVADIIRMELQGEVTQRSAKRILHECANSTLRLVCTGLNIGFEPERLKPETWWVILKAGQDAQRALHAREESFRDNSRHL